jgi:hypothetical protein
MDELDCGQLTDEYTANTDALKEMERFTKKNKMKIINI